MEVGGQRHAPTALPLGKRPGTLSTGGWVGPRADLDNCGKSLPHQDLFRRPFSTQRFAIPTTLTRPTQPL